MKSIPARWRSLILRKASDQLGIDREAGLLVFGSALRSLGYACGYTKPEIWACLKSLTGLEQYDGPKSKKTRRKQISLPAPVAIKLDVDFIVSEKFLSSYAWRQLRMQAILRDGRKCACCNRTPHEHGIVIHVDHIKPRRTHPELALVLDNLQVLCEDCNHGKGNWTDMDFNAANDYAKQHQPIWENPMRPRLLKKSR